MLGPEEVGLVVIQEGWLPFLSRVQRSKECDSEIFPLCLFLSGLVKNEKR